MMMKMLRSPVLFFTACFFLCSCAAPLGGKYVNEANYPGQIRVACVGDSITYGAGITDRAHNSYPAQLASMLGSKWTVQNFGVSGTNLLKQGDHPYWNEQAFKDALAFKPHAVVIKLGTNDSKPQNWAHKDDFVADYLALIRSFQELESKPR